MMKPEFISIGKITYKKLINVIHEYNLKEGDMIILDIINFDNIVLAYLEFYGTSMLFPHYLLGVEICENVDFRRQINKIGIKKG